LLRGRYILLYNLMIDFILFVFFREKINCPFLRSYFLLSHFVKCARMYVLV